MKKEIKPGQTIEFNGNKYYVDGPDKELKEIIKKHKSFGPDWELANRKVFFFNRKHFTDGDTLISQTRSWFDDKLQPTESQVRRAMIWSYDQFGDYQIKSGGESNSDSMFSSHFKVEIENPINGEDMSAVILKKYSTKFSDVLITIKEIEELFKLSATSKQLNQKRLNDLDSWLYFALTPARITGSTMTLEKVKERIKTDYSKEEVNKELDKRIEYINS